MLWCVRQRQLKLVDFGMSEYIPGHGSPVRIGCTLRLPMYVTANYRAPELWHASVVDLGKCLRPAVDLWSFACVLYEIAVGKVLMRPTRGNSSQSCHATIQEWCQQWQSLQKILQ